MATVVAETSALKINASNIKGNLIGSNKKLAKLRVEKIKIIDTISKESIRKKTEKRIETPIKGITPIIGGAFAGLVGMVKPIKDKLLNVFGTLLLAFAIDKLPKIIETLTVAYEKVKPVWTVATKTLRTIFDGIVSLKPFADQVYDFSKNTFTDISKKTQELTGIETEIDDDLKVFDGLFGEPQDIKEEEPQQEKETNIFSGVGSFFKNLLPGQKNQNKNKIKTQTSNQKTELSQLTREQQLILNGYRKKSTAGTSTQTAPTPTPTSAPSPTPVSGGGKFNESSLIRALNAAGYKNKKERAMFLAQMAHESGNFQFDEEIWGPTPTQRGYEGRSDLGNTVKGDGYRFRGRGYIQLTGRANYRTYGQKIGVDLLKNPDLAKRPDIAARIALEYWKSRVNRSAAQQGDVVTVTRNINGGTNGLSDRRYYYNKYLNRSDINYNSSVTPIRQNRSIPQSSGSSGGNQTFILPFGIEKIIPIFQGVSESEVNSTTQRRHQRRANNLP